MLPTTHEGEPETTIESRFIIIHSLELGIHNHFVRPVNPGTSWSRPPCNAWTAFWRPQKQRVTSCFREVWVTPPPCFNGCLQNIPLQVFCNLLYFISVGELPYPYFQQICRKSCDTVLSRQGIEVSICDKSHPIEGYLGAVLAPTFSRITRFDTNFYRFFYRGMDFYWFFSVYRGLLLGWGHVRYPRTCVWHYLRSVQTLEPTLQIPTFQKSILGGGQALVIVLGSVTRHFSIFLISTPSLVIFLHRIWASESLQNFVFLWPEDDGDGFEV